MLWLQSVVAIMWGATFDREARSWGAIVRCDREVRSRRAQWGGDRQCIMIYDKVTGGFMQSNDLYRT